MAYHDENVRNLKSARIQVDEAWAFIYAKQKNVAAAKAAPAGAGDVWTWVAMDADTKLVAGYFVGGRDGECAKWFIDDVAKRLANRVQLTSDGHKAYLEAVEGAFGADVDYAQLVKIYGASPESAKGRYSPADCTGAIKRQSKASLTRRTFQRRLSNVRTSRCGCTCAASRVSRTHSRKRSRTTLTPSPFT
jgi:hypothetical protein